MYGACFIVDEKFCTSYWFLNIFYGVLIVHDLFCFWHQFGIIRCTNILQGLFTVPVKAKQPLAPFIYMVLLYHE